MTVRQLRNILYRLEDEDEVLVLNENAPVKVAAPIKQSFSITEDGESNKLILMYESKNGKEGNK